MKTQPLWKKGVITLLLVETFLSTIGVFIHEAVHSFDFFILTGTFGEMHFFDSVAFSYNSFAVCIAPQGFVIQDTTSHELVAYGIQFLVTGLFAVQLIEKYYLSSEGMPDMKSGDGE